MTSIKTQVRSSWVAARSRHRDALALCLPIFGLLACSGDAQPAPAPSADGLLPVRLRRLSVLEYERTASELAGIPVAARAVLPPDLRVNGYSVNTQQSIQTGHVLALELIAGAAAPGPAEPGTLPALARALLGCSQPAARAAQRACLELELSRLSLRAFRRLPAPEEVQSLSELYERGATLADSPLAVATSGGRLVLQALLQAPSLLYLTELGEPGAVTGDVVRLGAFEVASLLSYALRGAPPDLALLERAHRGELSWPEVRESEARRLLSMSDTRFRFRQFVREWLEIADLDTLAKGEPHAQTWPRLRAAMLEETDRFVDAVLMHHGASLEQLLASGFSMIGPELAELYGLDVDGPTLNASAVEVDISGSGRVGVLQQGSFLAAHAHPTETSPVRRGDFVLRRLLCKELPRPSELDIEVVPPAPDPALTTRERFDVHVADALCADCHTELDAIGFTFENFDAIGGMREQENQKRVDTATELAGFGPPVRFADSRDLSRWLASLPEARACFLRQAFQYFFGAGTDAGLERTAADEFLRVADTLPDSRRDSLVEVLVAYVSSPAFIWRRTFDGSAP